VTPHPDQRVVRGPYEFAEPLRWTPPLAVGVYRVSSPGQARVFDEPSADYVVNLPTYGVYQIGGKRGAVVDAGRVVLFARGGDAPVTHMSPRHGGLYLRVRPDVAADVAAAVFGDGHDPRSAWSRIAALGPRARSLFLGLCEAARDLDDDALYERGVEVAEAVVRAASSVPGPSVSGPAAERVHAVRARLAANPGAPAPLDELAASVGWSRFQLARAFRAVTGQTVHDAHDALRLGVALERLRDPTIDLADLAYALGYSSHSHFTASFRRRFGRAPTAWRRAAARF
jgi:AraC-like DNA-binding protein